MKPNPIASTSSSIVEILQARAASTPDRNAYRFLSYASGVEDALSYAELNAAAMRIAAHLRSFTVPGDRALLLYRPGLDFIQGFLGCLYAGVIAVPAYPPHPTRPARDLPKLRGIAADARPAAILTSAAVLETCEPLFVETPDLSPIRRVATDALPSAGTLIDFRAGVDDLAFLQYTSGSTGTPKGVMVSHANLMHNERAIATIFGAGHDSTIVGWLPMYHDMGLIGTMLHGVYTGASCVLMSPMEFLEQPVRWLEAITRFGAHTSGGPNFAYDLCVRRVSDEQKAALDLSSWRIAFNGAEPVRAATLARFADAFAVSGFRPSAFFPCYGLAEATLAVSGVVKANEPDVRAFDADALETGRAVAHDAGALHVGCGVSIDDQRIVIVDPETRQPRADGEVGEIWVAGPSVAQGYWEKPEQSEQTFRARIAGTDEGPFLRTGDLGFVDRGELFVNGRRKDLVIIRGRNHYPHDLELTVEQANPAMRAGCGAAFSVDVDGAERLVVVHEVDRQYRGQANDGLAEEIRRRVAEEHEVPLHALVLIKTGSIPKTTSGKIQRSLTKKLFLDRALSVVAEWSWPSTESLTTADATTVAEIAARLLGRNAADLDPHAPLFALGLDSLQLFELKNAVERELAVELQLHHFMNDAGLATLAAHVEHARQTERAAPIVPMPIARTTGDQPLSNAQQRLWFLEQLTPGRAYNETLAMRLHGPLDADALERAVNVLVERHEALRTTFIVVDGHPVQHRGEWARIELAKFAGVDARRCIAEAAARPFDLARGPLLRATLVSTDTDQHVFAVTLHHIAADGWSTDIFLRELAAAYAGQTLAPLPIQYADYAAFLRARLENGVLSEQLAYWREALAGAPMTLALPFDRPRTALQTADGATLRFEVPRELHERLKQLARTENATLFMTLLAAFNVLLHRYSGQDDILVGSPVAGRNRAEVEGLIGFFVNTVVLRGDLSGDPGFRDVIARVKKAATGAYENQELPFETLVDELKPDRTLGQSPLFQVLFALQQRHERTIQLGALRGELIPVESGTSKFDLALSMEESANGLTGAFEYNADLFDQTTIARMLAHFQQFLAAAADDPSRPLSAMQLLTGDEREQVLVGFNRTEVRFDADHRLHRLFEQQAARTPQTTAVVFGESTLTYAQLDAKANQLAHRLVAAGVANGSPVGIYMERSLELVVAILGILKAGGAYLPLDAEYPQDRLAYMLENARVAAVVTQPHLIETLAKTSAPVVVLDEGCESIANEPAAATGVDVDPEQAAYVLFTSGTTDRPKGVVIPHRAICNHMLWMQSEFPIGAADAVLQKTPFSFDASVWEFYAPLLTGGRLVVARPGGHRDAAYLAATIRDERITVLQCVPTQLRMLLDDASFASCTSLRRVFCGGEALTGDLTMRFHAALGADLVNLYGPTEATIDATYWTCSRNDSRTHIPIGRPVANTQVYVVDRALRPLPVGIAGELLIGGTGLAHGYLHNEPMTNEKFVANTIGGVSPRLYRTGDLVRMSADGVLEFLGRIDHQVKLRGFRIELGEIEATLARQPGVQEAVVVAREDRSGDKRLVGYFVARAGASPLPADLRNALKTTLPEYMVPSAVVKLDAFPLLPNGKIDTRALPVPDAGRADLADAFVAPRNEIEEGIAAIWSDVLGHGTIGVRDNFFELGGHSLLATKIISRIRAAFRVELPLRKLFEAPTIENLAIAVATQRAEEQEEGELAEVLAQLEGLSEREVSEMLQATAPQR